MEPPIRLPDARSPEIEPELTEPEAESEADLEVGLDSPAWCDDVEGGPAADGTTRDNKG